MSVCTPGVAYRTFCQQAHDLKLCSIDILKFIHKHMPVFVIFIVVVEHAHHHNCNDLACTPTHHHHHTQKHHHT